MPISDLRKKKLLYVSNVFFDVNQNGTLEKKDFESAIGKICTLCGWPQSHPKNVETYDTMTKIWDGLKQRTDANKDRESSAMAVFMFDLEDASNSTKKPRRS